MLNILSKFNILFLFITSSMLFTVNSQRIIKSLQQKLFENYDPETRPVRYASNVTEICSGIVNTILIEYNDVLESIAIIFL